MEPREREAKETNLICPICSSPIVDDRGAFRCITHKWDKETRTIAGCKFFFWKEFFNIDIDEKELGKLIAGETLRKKMKVTQGGYRKVLRYEVDLFFSAAGELKITFMPFYPLY